MTEIFPKSRVNKVKTRLVSLKSACRMTIPSLFSLDKDPTLLRKERQKLQIRRPTGNYNRPRAAVGVAGATQCSLPGNWSLHFQVRAPPAMQSRSVRDEAVCMQSTGWAQL
jgi:hypothetical protein